MTKKVLKNKPLVEAIFELRWELQEPTPGMKIDPHYKMLVGRIYDRVNTEYSYHEQLPTATIPDEIAGYVVQHRFRKDKDKWPLIQIGPGIVTLNDTDGYLWEDFERRISYVLDTLFETYPDAKNTLEVNKLLLRYIDAVDFDYGKNNIFCFLREKMHVNIDVPEKLFENTGVSNLPLDFDLRFSFPSTRTKSTINLRFVRGKSKDVEALIWETMVGSVREDTPKAKEQITIWVKEAHDLTDDWFFKLIEGELLRRFE